MSGRLPKTVRSADFSPLDRLRTSVRTMNLTYCGQSTGHDIRSKNR